MILGPIIYIWLVTTLLGIISFPLLFLVSPRLRDRGYSISKILGLVMVTYLSWMLSSLKILPFNSTSLALATVSVAAASLWAGWKKRREISSFVREKFKLILGIETIFLIALFVFLLIISLNPNIDPDSERFMDYALLNSIDRTDYFPPLDPWLSGKTMNYYYYGYIIIAALHKLVRIPLPLYFNLSLGLVYALFTLTCFGIGYNLTGKKSYGLLAIIAIMLIGNLDGFIQIIQGKFSTFNLFHGARVLEQKSALGHIIDYPINEFPFFSLMWGDLHAYVIAFPLNLAILNLILNLALSPARGWKSLGEKFSGRTVNLVLLSLSIGALFGTNTWDYPIYLAVAIGVLAFNHWKAEGPLGKKVLDFLPPAIALSLISFVIYFPFNFDFIREQAGQGRGGIGPVPVRSPLGLFLVAFGIYLFFLVIFIFSQIKNSSPQSRKKIIRGPFIIFLIAVLVIISMVGPRKIICQTYLFLLLLFLLVLLILFISPRQPGEHFPLVLALAALGLAILCEFFFLIDHYQGGGMDRMNTVFKIYIHVWLFLGVAAVYFIFFINRLLKDREGFKLFWQTTAFAMLFLGFFYTLGALGEQNRKRRQPLTLDGIEYIYRPVPDYQAKEWRWDLDDWKAIEWIEDNIKGRPVILEMGDMIKDNQQISHAYHWPSRISTFTGLPTLVGWANHEAGWRNDWDEPGQRVRDGHKLYNTTDLNLALHLINKYGIKYVYIGKLERERYPSESLKKFAQIAERVYQEEPVEIFRVGN